MTLGEIAGVVGGEVVDGEPGLAVTGPAFLDSRTPEPGGLFVAFDGEHVDGHDFAVGAVRSGAAAVLGSRATGVPTVVVPDAQAALQELARQVLRRLWEADPGPKVVAITGSQGKTTAKDMLARVLADAGPTIATAGSFNNELGLPLTVLRATTGTRYLILEMGARGVGHLAELCEIAPPDISLVLNVGKAHIGEFGSQDNIALAKGELVEALSSDGVAVLNTDDPLVAAMAGRTRARVQGFGHSPIAEVRLDGVQVDDLGRASFDLSYDGATEHVALNLVGEHQAMNAAATTATALAAGLPLDSVAVSLRSIDHLSKWRMEVHERADGVVVVNDAYNANPDSMLAALETLGRMGERGGRRTIAVLGEMRELGASAEEEHRALGALAHRLGIDQVVVVGPGARAIHEALVEERGEDGTTRHVETVEQAGEWLRENVAGPDVVLVKASRAGRLERVADMLLGIDPHTIWERRPADVRAILLAGGLSLLLTLLGTRYAIRVLSLHGYGQLIRDDGPTTHHTKRGTPTMGGLVIVLASVLAYFLAKLITQTTPSASAMLLLFLFIGLGTVGFLDDYIKIARQRSLGLRSRAKFIGQTFVALVFGWLALSPMMEDDRGQTPAGHAISFIRDPRSFTLPMIVLLLFIWLMIAGSSNAVNLTDGLDGLAAGAAVMTFGAYTLVNIWQNNQWCGRADGPKCYEVRDPLDLAVVAAAITGACFGFLWWNASPGEDHHGRHRLPGPRRRARRVRRTHPHRVPARAARRTVRDPDAVGHPPGRLLQGHQGQTHSPDGTAAPPLRDAGLGGDHGRGPLLADRRDLRGRRAGGLLRRMGCWSLNAPWI